MLLHFYVRLFAVFDHLNHKASTFDISSPLNENLKMQIQGFHLTVTICKFPFYYTTLTPKPTSIGRDVEPTEELATSHLTYELICIICKKIEGSYIDKPGNYILYVGLYV